MSRNFGRIICLCVSFLASASMAYADQATCLQTAQKGGSFFTGNSVLVSDAFPSLTPDAAYLKIYRLLLQNNWKVSDHDKELGTISATHADYMGSNESANSMNVIVAPAGTGAKVTLTRKTVGGAVGIPRDFQKEGLCEMLATLSAP